MVSSLVWSTQVRSVSVFATELLIYILINAYTEWIT
jgi:hypothetical protein